MTNPRQTLAAFVYDLNDTYPSNLIEIQTAVTKLKEDPNLHVQVMVSEAQDRLNEWSEWKIES